MEDPKPTKSNNTDNLQKSEDADYEAYLNRTVKLADEGFGRIGKKKAPFFVSSLPLLSNNMEKGPRMSINEKL